MKASGQLSSYWILLLGLPGALEGATVAVFIKQGALYLLLIISLGLLAFLLLDRPLVILALVFSALPLFQREVYFGFYWVSLIDLLLYLYFLALFMRGLILPKSRLVSIPFSGHLGMAAVLFIPSFLNSPHLGLSVKDWIRYLIAVIAYASVYYSLVTAPQREQWVNRLVKILVAGGGVSALAYFVDFVRRGLWGVSSIIAVCKSRPTGLFIDPNYFAEFLITIVPLAVTLLLVTDSRILKLGAIGITDFSILAILLTFSRSALLALAGVGGILFFLLLQSERGNPQGMRKLALWAAVIVIFLVVFLARAKPVSPSLFIERISSLKTGQEGDELLDAKLQGANLWGANLQDAILETANLKYSLSSRRLILQTAFNMIRSQPLIGVGLGAFEEVFDSYRPEGFFQSRQVAHNTFVRLWAETGILGFGVITLFTLRVIRYLFHCFSTVQDRYWKRVLAGLLAGWLGSVIMSLTLDQFQLVYFWIYLGLTMAVARIAQSSSLEGNRLLLEGRRMWNVLYIDYKPILAGGQIALLSLLREIDKKHVNATVVVPSESPFTEELGRTGIHFQVIDLGKIQKSSNPILIFKNLLERVVPTIKLMQLIQRERIDVVHASGTFSFIASCLAAKLTRVPVIWWVHNSGLPQRNGIFLIPFIWLADRIMVVTESTRHEFTGLVKEAEGKITTIYNAVDLRRFEGLGRREDKLQELGISKDDLVIGTVSRLAPEKGLTHFIDAAAQVRTLVPEACFLIVGDGPLKTALEAEVHQKGLGNRVIFTGFRKDVLDLVSIIDIFVLSATSRETLSIAVLEAMALEKPVVATNVGGLYELIANGENGFLVPPGDPQSLSQALIALSADRGRRIAMGKAGRRRVEQRYRIEDMVEKTLRLYRELIHEDRRQSLAL